MKKIEEMVRAFVDDGDHYITDAPRVTWLDLSWTERRELDKGMRAALSALAKCDLSTSVTDEALDAYNAVATSPDKLLEGFAAAFAVMLRSIAEE